MKKLLFLFILVNHFSVFAQSKKIYTLDSSYISRVFSLNAKSIGFHPISGNPFVVGDFIATTINAQSRVPFFYFEQNILGNPLYYFNNLTVTSITQGNSFTNDQNGNLYICGGSNDTKFVSKINNKFQVEWTIQIGHHIFDDIAYHNGYLYAFGQDEDSLAKHTSLVAKLDTMGSFSEAKNYGNTENFNQPKKILVNQKGIYSFSQSQFNGKFSVFITHTGHKFSFIKTTSFYKEGSSMIVSDVKEKNKAFYITGYFKINQKDSAYVLKLDSNLNQVFFKTYSSGNGNFWLDANAIEINENSIFIGGTYLYNTNRKRPFIIKTDLQGNVLWSATYQDHTIDTDETLHGLKLNKTSDSILFTGNYRQYDSVIVYNPKFYIETIDTDLGKSGCKDTLQLITTNYTLKDTSIVKIDDYFSTYGNYPFDAQLDFVYEDIRCLIIDTLKDTTSIAEFKNLELLVRSTPNFITIEQKHNNQNYPLELHLYNLMGQTLFQQKYSNFTQEQISTQNLAKGVYILHITTPENSGLKQKVVVF